MAEQKSAQEKLDDQITLRRLKLASKEHRALCIEEGVFGVGVKIDVQSATSKARYTAKHAETLAQANFTLGISEADLLVIRKASQVSQNVQTEQDKQTEKISDLEAMVKTLKAATSKSAKATAKAKATATKAPKTATSAS